ncbi:FtsX-like permease family protein [Nonomuraea basaltis]|uniref:FtsX-like permease family protein n=1 Tax=Nonomuraea basaltis TaxID=2495887 RepID=UPI0014864CAC|nr:FtsX-like permease family protein [Nonomuraea basaltis]
MLKRAQKHVSARRVQGATGRRWRGGGSLALAWDLARGRWGSLAGTFLALGLAVGILSMTGLVFASAQPQVPARYAGAAVLVKTPSTGGEANGLFYPDKPWPPEQARSLAERLGRIPRVAAAVPDRTFYAQAVIGGKPVAGDTQGYLWPSAALAPYRLAAGKPPAGPDEVVVSRALGLAPGRQVTVLTAAGPASYSVSGTVAGPGYYFAQARTGGVRVIGLVAEAGADVAAIERAARAVVGAKGLVLSGEARSATEPVADVQTRWFGYQILSGMAILVAFTAVFIVASTFAFGVAQRRRELGLLRTVGATPRQMRALMHGEALVIGVAAAAVGVAVGTVCAPGLGQTLVNLGFQPPSFAVEIQLWPMLACFAAGLVVAQLGVWAASRRAAKVAPLEALREAVVDERPMTAGRWVFGALFTLVGVVVGVFIAGESDSVIQYSFYAAGTLIVGLSLLAPAVIPPLVHAVSWPVRSGAIGMLVRQGALTAVRRTASTAAPVLVTVGFAVLVTGMVETNVGANGLRRAAAVQAQWVLAPQDTPGLTDAAVSAAGGSSTLPTTVYTGDRPFSAAGVAGRTKADVIAGDLQDLRGGQTMAVAEWAARERGWRVGTAAPVAFEDGQSLRLTVVAVLKKAPADILLTRQTVRDHDPSALTEPVYLPTPTAVPADTGAVIEKVTDRMASIEDHEDELVWVFVLILVGLSVGYSAISIANTLLMATTNRTTDLRVLRLSGATTGQVLRTVALESTLVVAIGALLGIAVAVTALVGITTGLTNMIGMTVGMILPWPIIGAVIGICLLLAVAASVIPARTALQPPRP